MSTEMNGRTTSRDLILRFTAPAMKIPEDKVQVCRADVRIVFVNVKHGVHSVFGLATDPDRKDRVATIQEVLPKVRVAWLLELPELARALMLATQKVAPPVSAGEIERQLTVVRNLREPILCTAEVLAGKGLFPKAQVAKIRKGTGKYDMACDGVALADLFEQHEDKVAGKHPFTAAEFETMRTASEWLLDHLKPTGAKARPSAKTDAEDLRDRLWTLLVQRHPQLRMAGYYLFQDDFEDKTPKLTSRIRSAKSETAETTDEASADAASDEVTGDEVDETDALEIDGGADAAASEKPAAAPARKGKSKSESSKSPAANGAAPADDEE